MSNALRCCAIGATGKWFQSVHAPSLQRLARAGKIQLAAATSRSEEGRELITGKLGFARSHSDVDEMLDVEKPDYVVLSMASRPMGEMAARLLERGTPLLMEKPAGHNIATGRRLADVAEKTGTPHMVAYNRRHNPLLTRLKEIVEERGGVSQLSCEFLRHDVSAPRKMMGSALHSIDALRYLAGEVSGFDGAASATRYFDEKAMAASFHLSFESGVVGSFTFNVRAGRSYERYRVFAENWTATVSLPSPGKYDDRWWLCVEDGDREVESVTLAGLPEEERNGACIHGFWREHEHFADCLEKGARPSPEIADGLASMKLAESMLEAVAPEQVNRD